MAGAHTWHMLQYMQKVILVSKKLLSWRMVVLVRCWKFQVPIVQAIDHCCATNTDSHTDLVVP